MEIVNEYFTHKLNRQVVSIKEVPLVGSTASTYYIASVEEKNYEIDKLMAKIDDQHRVHNEQIDVCILKMDKLLRKNEKMCTKINSLNIIVNELYEQKKNNWNVNLN